MGTTERPHTDDSQMSRFEREAVDRFSAWDAVKAVGLIAVVLVVLSGGSVRQAGEQLDPGIGRDLVLAVAEPAEWVAEQLPLDGVNHDLTGWLSPDIELGGGGFDDLAGAGAPRTPPASPGAEPGAAAEPLPLTTVLVTGDSLSTPLDVELARLLAGDVEVIRDPHLATGISNSALADWGELSTAQVAKDAPDATVVFIGANEGYPLPAPGGGEVACCAQGWIDAFTARVTRMMETYSQGSAARVYWLTIPAARDPDRREIARAVNDAYVAAAESFPDTVRIVDMVETFTPGDVYRDAIEIQGRETIVREPDGIHLNEAGSDLAAEIVLAAIDRDFIR